VGIFVVVVLDFAIPAAIKKDIIKIRAALFKIFKNLRRNNSNPTSFNAANHLFISTRVAKKYPRLPISKLILQFSNTWPTWSYHQFNSISDESSFRNSIISNVTITFLFIFINMPNNLQDYFIQFISTFIIDGIIILCITLFNISPALIVFPVSFFFLSFCFLHKFLSDLLQSSSNINAEVQSAEVFRDDISESNSDSDHSGSTISLWSYHSSCSDEDQSSYSSVNILANVNETSKEEEFIESSSSSASAEWCSLQTSYNSSNSFTCSQKAKENDINWKSIDNESKKIFKINFVIYSVYFIIYHYYNLSLGSNSSYILS
jgi:hypothetical protein